MAPAHCIAAETRTVVDVSARGGAVDDATGAASAGFAWLVTVSFLIVGGLSAAFHEPWRDEAQAWLLARDSSGLAGLVRNARWEGGPLLWHLLLFPLTRWAAPSAMLALNLGFAAATVYLFARYSGLAKKARVLFAFGYLPLYEWGTIARNYALGVFLLFLFAVCYARRCPLWAGTALALAANTSPHAAVVAAGGLLLLLSGGLSRATAADERHRRNSRRGTLLAAAGLLLSALQTLPPAGGASPWMSEPSVARIGSVAYAFRAGLAPFADCWFSVLPGLASPWWQLPLGLLAWIAAIAFVTLVAASLARRRTVWIVAASSTLGLGVLFFLLWWRGPRHAGFLFVTALLSLWLAPLFPRRQLRNPRLDRIAAVVERRAAFVTTGVLGFHAAAGIIAVVAEVLTVFSAARMTAALIHERGWSALPVVADSDLAAASVVAHLGVRAVHYPQVGRWGSFTIWGDHTRDGDTTPANDDLVFERAATDAALSDVVVVINRQPKAEAIGRARAVLVGHLAADIVPDESYWVYRIPARQGER